MRLTFLALMLAGVPALAQWDLGGVAPVHQELAGWQEFPRLEVDAAGRFFVAFEDLQVDDQQIGHQSIRGTFLSGDVGTPFPDLGLSDSIFARSCDAALPRYGVGRAVWISDSADPDVFLGVFGAAVDVVATEVGQQRAVTSNETYFASSTRVAAWENGFFVAAWVEVVLEPIEELILFAQRFDAAGSPAGARVLVEPPTPPGSGFNFDVAAQADGGFAVIWSRDGLDPDGFGVLLRAYDRHDQPRGPARQVNEYLAGDQFMSRLASDGSGRLLAVWRSDGQDGSGGGIYARRFDVDATPLAPEFQVSSNYPSHQSWPHASLDSYGNAAIAWESFTENPNTYQDVWARLYRSDGSPRGEQFLVNTNEIAYGQTYPSVALSDGGIVGFAWQSWRLDTTATVPDLGYDTMFRRMALPCEEDGETLCLQSGRFLVRAFWRTPFGDSGAAQALPLTSESGGFWFFAPDNFELLVKVLDGCGTNGNYWVFLTGLTDVAVDVVVTDTWSGRSQTHRNAMGSAFQPVQQVSALPTCDVADPSGGAFGESARETVRPFEDSRITESTGLCPPGPTVLCLEGGRFQVRATWADFFGNEGDGQGLPLGDDSGLFWFFWPENVELAVKVLDGCGVNNRYWVFASGLTSVAVTLEVTDLATSQVWLRSTALGQRFPSVLDSSAFATCL